MLLILFVFLLIVSFTVQIFIYTMNEISDRILGTNYNKTFKEEKTVRFASDEIITYNLSNEERQMKKDAYKKIRRSTRHYRRMEQLTRMMDNLNINPNKMD